MAVAPTAVVEAVLVLDEVPRSEEQEVRDIAAAQQRISTIFFMLFIFIVIFMV